MFSQVSFEISGGYAPAVPVEMLQDVLAHAWNSYARLLAPKIDLVPSLGDCRVNWWFTDDWKPRNPHDRMPLDAAIERHIAIDRVNAIFEAWWSSTLHGYALGHGFMPAGENACEGYVRPLHGPRIHPAEIARQIAARQYPRPRFNPPSPLPDQAMVAQLLTAPAAPEVA